jgi:ribonuclease HI
MEHKKKKKKKYAQRTHRDRVSNVTDERSLWGLAAWCKNRHIPQAASTPDIKRKDGTLAEDLQSKCAALKETLFPKPPNADLNDLEGFQYQPPKGKWVPIIPWEITEVLREAPPDKAPGGDTFPNRVLKATGTLLIPWLTIIFNASLTLEYCPEHFKGSITVVLRKPGKDDYSEPKSYRPIALMNTLGKLLDGILARRITYLAERHRMLPIAHAGGRRLASCEHGIHVFLERIHSVWRERQVASMLLLDVSGAFDNVSHKRLLHNLRKRGIHPQLVGWLSSYLTGRKSTLKLSDGIGEEFTVDTGIPQGSPLSPILYLFYNADMLEIDGTTVSYTVKGGYIDDVGILVSGEDTTETIEKLTAAAAECEKWARTHASVFAVQKFELIHFVHKRDRKRVGDLTLPLQLPLPNGGIHTIEPASKARYLGVILDPNLTWGAHIKHIEDRATKSIAALQAISGSTWGVSRNQLLKLYKAIVVPQMLFASLVWYIPQDYTGEKTRRKQMLSKLGAIQKKALCIATGAFKTTALSVLEAETATPPMEFQLLQSALISTVRILGTPIYRTVIANGIRTGLEEHPDTQRLSPLQRLEAKLQEVLGIPRLCTFETFLPALVEPWWKPPDIYIALDTDAAVQNHNRIRDNFKAGDLYIYTDGSDINGHVGAAAWCEQMDKASKMYMGTSSDSTVYAAELMGISQALSMTIQSGRDTRRVFIFTDNQASILSHARPRFQSGQYILNCAINQLKALKARGVSVEIHWIPAHIGVPGNEKVDQLAKEASGYNAPRGHSLTWLPRLKAATKRVIKKACQTLWHKSWSKIDTGHLYRRRYGNGLNRHINTLYAGMPKAVSSILTQMRVEKIGLAGYLFAIKRAEEPACECETSNQTVAHILEECPLYRKQRRRHFSKPVLRDTTTILSDPRMAEKAANFMLSTGLLDQFRHYKTALYKQFLETE